MTDLEQLEQIYREYEEKLSQATANASVFAGAFGMGDDPRKDACNQIFMNRWASGRRHTRNLSPRPGRPQRRQGGFWSIRPGIAAAEPIG